MSATGAPQAWHALVQHHVHIGTAHLRDLFAADPARGTRWSVEAAGLYFDYSKNRMDGETMTLLVALARQCEPLERIAGAFDGEPVNTERRARDAGS